MKPFCQPNETDVLHGKVMEAKEAGILDPVIFAMDHANEWARAFYEKVRGQPMQAVEIGGNRLGAIEVAPRLDAVDVLRLHGGNVGSLIAESLVEDLPADRSFVNVKQDSTSVMTFTDARKHLFMMLGHANGEYRLHESRPSSKTNENITIWRLTFLDGESAPLCCGTEIVLEVANLIQLVRHRTIRGREAYAKDLALALLGYENRPQVIAEAIRALRKLGSEADRWLLDVLWGRVKLRPIARKVERELKGTMVATGNAG